MAHEPENVDEIEITPEMIEVGLESWLEHAPEPFLDRMRVALASAYTAMRKASPGFSSSAHRPFP